MIARGGCGCRKVSCSSYAAADRLRIRTNLRNKELRDAGSVYWCPEGHAYHWTSMTRAEYDRTVARACLGSYPPSVDKPRDNPVDDGGRRIDLRGSGDNSGAATATLDLIGLEILPVCAANRAERVGKSKAVQPLAGRTATLAPRPDLEGNDGDPTRTCARNSPR